MAEAAKSCFCGAVAAFGLGEFHRIFGGGSKFLILKCDCCLCAWWVSWARWRRQQILDFEAWLLPLLLVSFIGSTAEAAKSCFRGVVAAFVLGEFHGLDGGGSKILLLWHGCCLCAWWVSWARWRRQQNPASVAWLLPLGLVSFIGSSAEAAISCFCGVVAAFGLGGFHGLDGGGSKILLP